MNPTPEPDSRKSSSEVFLRYAVAASSVAAGWLLRLALDDILGSTVPYITFFPAVMLAAWFGGLGPGILATALSLGAVLYSVIPALGSVRPVRLADATGAIIFVVVAVFICVLNEALRRSRGRSEEGLRQLTLEIARRTSTEEALAQSKHQAESDRDLLRITLSSIGDAVITADSEGRVTFLNAVAQQLTGWSQADAVGKAMGEVFVIRNEQTRLPAESPVERAMREGVVTGLANHTILFAKDGQEIPIEDSAAPIRDGRRKVLGAVLVFRDVTAQRKSENAVKHSEERLKLALAAGQIGVWDWDVVRNKIEWSDLLCEIHGIEPGKFHGGVDDFAQLIHPEDRVRINQAIKAALLQGVPYDVEFRTIRPNGDIRSVCTTAVVFRDAKGEATSMLGAVTDVTARRQAERLFRQQWRTFDTALSNTPDSTYIFDLEGRFTYLNRGLLSLLQRPFEDAVGKKFFELDYPPELAAHLQRQIEQVIATRQPVRDQTPFTGPTGETRQYEYIFVPVLAANGSVEAVAGSTRDMTERISAEEARRKSEERLRFALEAGGGVGTWDWDVPGDRFYCDPQFAKLYSVDPVRAAAGAPVLEFVERIHPDDRRRVGKRFQQAVKAGEEFAEEYRIVQQDGSVRWVYARGRCHLDEAGKPTRFPGVTFDITERKGAEEALRESRDHLRAIYDGTKEYIGLLTPEGTLLECNRALLQFANNTREEVVGLPFWETPWFSATPGAPQVVREGVARAAAGEVVRFEASVRRPSGDCPTFDISLHPVTNAKGEVVLIVPEGVDITERKRTEEDLRRSNQELKRVNRELEEFAYVASHDLQEPLRMVNIYTELIVRDVGGKGAKLAQYSEFVRRGVNRMETLIRDLLTFSRTVHTEEELPIGVAHLSVSLVEALSVLKNPADESGALITAEALPNVRGDTSQMAQVFQNLLSNAFKYRKKDVRPQIEIAAVQSGGDWVICVKDNGIGFEARYAERIFGLFKRLHNEEYAGTGLGLAICRRIVERYGGRIWAEGTPGEGASFYFSLPAAAETSGLED